MKTLAEKSYRIFFWGIPTEALIIAAFLVRLEGQYNFKAFFELLLSGGGYRRLPPWLFAFICGLLLLIALADRVLQPRVRIEICEDMLFINGAFHKTEGILLSQVMSVRARSGYKSTEQGFSTFETPERTGTYFGANLARAAAYQAAEAAANAANAGTRNLSTAFLRKSGSECGTIILRVNGEELRDINIHGINDVFGVYDAILAEAERYKREFKEEIEEHIDEARQDKEEWLRKSRYTPYEPFGSADESAGNSTDNGEDKP